MRLNVRCVMLAALLLMPSAASFAQTAADPSGHWEGIVSSADAKQRVELDITKDAKGSLTGTFGEPGGTLRRVPLSSVVLTGRTLRVIVNVSQATSTYEGTIAENGKSFAGLVKRGDAAFPFTLVRTGDARVSTVPKNAGVPKPFEGVWNGVVDAGTPGEMRVRLTIANQPDGTAFAAISSPDGSGMEMDVALTLKGSSLFFEAPAIEGSWKGALSADGTELAGTWTQAGNAVPLAFKKGAK